MSRFDDYIRDIPLEIHERFYPKSQIILPLTLLPRLANVPVYNFDVEQRARRAYESRNDKEEPLAAVPSVEPVQMLHPSPSTSSLPNTLEILQPSRVDNSIVGIPVVPPEAKPVMSFEEFESKGTVFDEVEWRSIDDRKALSQILNGNASSPSETATQAPIPAPRQSVFLAGVNLRSYPNLSRSINHETQHAKIINGSTVSYSSPDSSKTVGTVVVDQAKETTKIPLRERLLAKGYRENLVNVATAKVPRQRIVHIEYYMKGMSVLEKRGVSAEESLTYLLESGVTDKQDILQRADAADGLLAMELNRKDVFAALLKADGDKQKAFDIIMP